MKKNKSNTDSVATHIKAKKYHPERVAQKRAAQKELNIAHNAVQYQLYQFNTQKVDISFPYTSDECLVPENDFIRWLNIDGLQELAVRKIGAYYGIHNLQIDDILSEGQRAKWDDFQDDKLFVLMPMLRLNTEKTQIETEQLSIIIGNQLLISFQSEHTKDPFMNVRKNIKNEESPLRLKSKVDFLFYSLIDAVVDDYFTVLDYLSDQLSFLETRITDNVFPKRTLHELSIIRKEILFVKREITPVRDLVNSLYSQENDFIQSGSKKYFKDILDHTMIAIEYAETYLDWSNNLQDLYMSQLNSKTNDVMKILTVVTTLLAPATVVGSIFGMNFEKMPLLQNENGFLISIAVTFLLSILMLMYFKKKQWF